MPVLNNLLLDSLALPGPFRCELHTDPDHTCCSILSLGLACAYAQTEDEMPALGNFQSSHRDLYTLSQRMDQDWGHENLFYK